MPKKKTRPVLDPKPILHIYCEGEKTEPNYINGYLEKFNSLKGENRRCTYRFLQDYKNRIFKHCMQTGYAENIGGGCYHIVGNSLHIAILEKALTMCEVKF